MFQCLLSHYKFPLPKEFREFLSSIQNMLPLPVMMMMLLLLIPWPGRKTDSAPEPDDDLQLFTLGLRLFFHRLLFGGQKSAGSKSTSKGRERERAKPTVKVYYFHKFTFISTFMWIYWILFCRCWSCPVDLFVHCCCWQNFHPRVWPHHSWGKKRNGNDDDSGEREFAHVRVASLFQKDLYFINLTPRTAGAGPGVPVPTVTTTPCVGFRDLKFASFWTVCLRSFLGDDLQRRGIC